MTDIRGSVKVFCSNKTASALEWVKMNQGVSAHLRTSFFYLFYQLFMQCNHFILSPFLSHLELACGNKDKKREEKWSVSGRIEGLLWETSEK